MAFDEINEATLAAYFERLDPLVKPGTVLFVFGGAAIALLGAKIRTTVDIDVAAPYSKIDLATFREASEKAGLPVNPPPGCQSAYLEIVGGRMLSLPEPAAGRAPVVLFSGVNLTVATSPDADLVASKLVRYNDKDRGDVQFLAESSKLAFSDVENAVRRIPANIRDDVLVRENLENFRGDLAMWRTAT